MDMNLVVDAGNTRIKAAVFQNDQLVNKFTVRSPDQLKIEIEKYQLENALVSSVNHSEEEFSFIRVSKKNFFLTTRLPLPITNGYGTPATLGLDRLAAACGAFSLFPTSNCLVIDAGTCINYEFINDQGIYLGGAISPGIEMRYKAMHTFTARLPLITSLTDVNLLGTNTEECMQSGVVNGVISEVNGIIDRYREKHPSIVVLICGGNAPFFENRLKPTIFAAPDLVLMGLNRILRYNASI
jgi:type III pantothenate kinase